MTKEQILELMKTDDGKAILTEVGLISKAEANLIAIEKNQAIETKNKELLAKLAAKKDNTNISDTFQKTLDTLGVKDYNEAVELLYKAKNPGESDELREYKTKMSNLLAENTTFKGELDSLKSANSNAISKLKSKLINDEIQKTLMSEKFGLKKGQAKALSTYLTNQTTFELSEDLDSALTKEGQTPEQFVMQWAEKPESEDYLPAKINIGGGAGGSQSKQETDKKKKPTFTNGKMNIF